MKSLIRISFLTSYLGLFNLISVEFLYLFNQFTNSRLILKDNVKKQVTGWNNFGLHPKSVIPAWQEQSIYEVIYVFPYREVWSVPWRNRKTFLSLLMPKLGDLTPGQVFGYLLIQIFAFFKIFNRYNNILQDQILLHTK